MRAEEFAVKEPASPPSIQATDFTIDSHTNPSLARVTLCWAKTDLLGKGVEIYFGRTDTPICPVLGLLSYIAIHQAGTSSAPLLIHADGSPLTRDQFVRMVKKTLRIDQVGYSGHSFWIGAASTAAAAGVPAYFIKMLERRESEVYHLYIKTPCASLAAVSWLITN